nr:DUF1566 domain-containing protein [uncultured Campylobacter sp.]
MKKVVIFVLFYGLLNAGALDVTCYRDNDKNVVICSEAKLGKLMWQDETQDFVGDWRQANEYCKLVNLAGYDDRRLPTIEELISITDKNKFRPSINSAFKKLKYDWYWSSTERADTPSLAWIVGFMEGNVIEDGISVRNLVICVRND